MDDGGGRRWKKKKDEEMRVGSFTLQERVGGYVTPTPPTDCCTHPAGCKSTHTQSHIKRTTVARWHRQGRFFLACQQKPRINNNNKC